MRSVVEILVDCSPAMSETLCSGRTKLDVAKDVLKRQILPRLTDRLVGIHTFGDCCQCSEGAVVRAPKSLSDKSIAALVDDLDGNGQEQPALHIALESCLFSLYESSETRDLTKQIIIFSAGKNPCGFECAVPTVANAVRWVDLKRTLQHNQDLKITCIALGRVYEPMDLGDEEIMSRWEILLAGSRVLEQNVTAIEGFLSPLLGMPAELVRGVDRLLPIYWGQRRLEDRIAAISEMQYGLADHLQRVLTGSGANSGRGSGVRHALVGLSLAALLVLVVVAGLRIADVQYSIQGLTEKVAGTQVYGSSVAVPSNTAQVCTLSEIEAHCNAVMDRAVEDAMKVVQAYNDGCAAGDSDRSGAGRGDQQGTRQSIQDLER